MKKIKIGVVGVNSRDRQVIGEVADIPKIH